MTVSSVLGRVSLGGYRLVQRARNKSFSLLVGGGFVAFGRRTVIELPVRISGERRISIGPDVFLGRGAGCGSIQTERAWRSR